MKVSLRRLPGFNDPTAWGFCEYCAYEVAVDDGVRVDHQVIRLGPDTALCNGSGKPVAVAAPIEAQPLNQVSLYKTSWRASSRARNQRMRSADRERKRTKEAA